MKASLTTLMIGFCGLCLPEQGEAQTAAPMGGTPVRMAAFGETVKTGKKAKRSGQGYYKIVALPDGDTLAVALETGAERPDQAYNARYRFGRSLSAASPNQEPDVWLDFQGNTYYLNDSVCTAPAYAFKANAEPYRAQKHGKVQWYQPPQNVVQTPKRRAMEY